MILLIDTSSEHTSYRCPSAVRCSLCDGTDSSSSLVLLAFTSNSPPSSSSTPGPLLIGGRGDCDDALELPSPSLSDALLEGGGNAGGKDSTGARTRVRDRGGSSGGTSGPVPVERWTGCRLGDSGSRLLSVADAFERFPLSDSTREGA